MQNKNKAQDKNKGPEDETHLKITCMEPLCHEFKGKSCTSLGQDQVSDQQMEDKNETLRPEESSLVQKEDKRASEQEHNLKVKESSFVQKEDKRASDQERNLSSQIESQLTGTEALERAKQTTDEVLKRHMSKITFNENELKKSRESAVEDKFTSDYILALEKQLTQLKNQRQAFLNHCNALWKTQQGNEIDRFIETLGIECNRLSKAHPVYASRRTLLKYLKTNQVCLISGLPGTGISTQIVQYLLDAGYADDGVIVSSQPKMPGVLELAERVAKDLICRVGDVVGYKIASSNMNERKTKIMFTTHDCLLKDCVEDPELWKYSCIFLDNAHERTTNTDVLMAVIKRCLIERDDLRVVICVAEEDLRLFANYFNIIHGIQVSREMYPVEVLHEEERPDSFEQYEVRAVSKAADIHSSGVSGDILVFLSTPLEIMRCCSEFEKIFEGQNDFKCLALHDYLSREERQKVFDKVPDRLRKIIFTLDNTETLEVIENVRFVVDTGVILERSFDPRRRLRILGTRTISKKTANHRKNLVSRNPGGECHRLYSKEDFQSFKDTDEPEILRSDLAPALLQLLSLGFSIRAFDFLQRPSRSAFNSAFWILECFGALKKRTITAVGKWILTLPYGITNNYFIYRAHKQNLTYEAIVIASLQFYNGDVNIYDNNDTHSNRDSFIKNKYICEYISKYGDVFTSFQIFRKWFILPKNERASWCNQSGINDTFLRFIQNCIKDVLTILRDELGVNVARTFSFKPHDQETLRKIQFNVNAASLSHYFDNGKSGYKSVISRDIVTVHPDSSLALLDTPPKWIVFTDVWKSSREFITGITVVDDNWIAEASEFQRAQVDTTEVALKYYCQVGPSVFKSLVGPCFGKLWELDKERQSTSGDRCVVEADKDKGTLHVYSESAIDESFVDTLDAARETALTILLSATLEMDMDMQKTSSKGGIKVIVGRGGFVKKIVTPIQSKKVLVKRAPKKVTINKVFARFNKIGRIDLIKKFQQPNENWGFIEFGYIQEALMTVTDMTNDRHYAIELIKDPPDNHTTNVFEATASWYKQPELEETRAVIRCSPLDRAILNGKYLDISGALWEITVSPSNDRDLIIRNVESLTVDAIKIALTGVLLAQSNAYPDLHVSLIKVKNLTSIDPCYREKQRTLLSNVLKNHIKEEDFKVQMPRLCENNSQYMMCFIQFSDMTKGQQLCHAINRHYDIDGEEIEFTPCYSTTLRVPKNVEKVCREQLLSIFDYLEQNYHGLDGELIQTGEHFALELKSSSVDSITEAYSRLSDVLKGRVFDLSTKHYRDSVLNEKGQTILKDIQRITGCLLVPDFRRSTIHLYGPTSQIRRAQEAIESYICSLDRLEVKIFSLVCVDGCSNLVTPLLRSFGPNLDEFVKECGLQSASINLTHQSLRAVGTRMALHEANQRLKVMECHVILSDTTQKSTDLFVCTLCKSPIQDQNGLFHRLETCSHMYCLHCLLDIVHLSLQNKILPLTCIAEKCDAQFVVADLKVLLSRNIISEANLVTSIIKTAVSLNSEKFCFCPTVNCPVVYSTTQEAIGSEFVCPKCFFSVCTSCHKPFHRGMTCQQTMKPLNAEQQKEPQRAPDHLGNSIASWVSETVSGLYKFFAPPNKGV